MRFIGSIKSWNQDRGFGFISPTHGGQDLFIHISSFPREVGVPKVGQVFTFEIETESNGKKRAVKIGYVGKDYVKTKPKLNKNKKNNNSILSFILIIILGISFYNSERDFLSNLFETNSNTSKNIQSVNNNKSNSNKSFKCDGRTHCSQMTSCDEAKFFLANCPGAEMDGNNDGTPCEKQWCH